MMMMNRLIDVEWSWLMVDNDGMVEWIDNQLWNRVINGIGSS